MAENVFVIGATGNVGRRLVKDIFSEGDTDALRHKNYTRVVGLASSESYLFDVRGLDRETSEAFASKRIIGKRYETDLELASLLRCYTSFGESMRFRVIDVTASPDMLKLHKAVISETQHTLVTANKLPLAQCTYDEFKILTKEPRRYGYRCSVMAGADAVPFLQDLRDLGEKPVEIVGCFSGTNGYITSETEKGTPFSEVVSKAHALEYTEPHPARDLSGMDVASKLLILVRTAGCPVKMEDIKVEPLIPAKYLASSDVKQFFADLKGVDIKMKGDFNFAQMRQEKLRYVASAIFNDGRINMSVGLRSLKIEHPLAQLTGTANKIIITAGPYGSNGSKPYSIEAPGAGIEITARNVRRDLLHQIERWEIA